MSNEIKPTRRLSTLPRGANGTYVELAQEDATSFPNKEAGARSFYAHVLEPSLRNRWTAQLWYDAHPRPNRRFAAAICT